MHTRVPNVAQDCEEAQAIHQAIEWVWEDTLHQAPLRSVLDIALPEASNIVCDTVGAIEWACPVGGAENEPSRMRVRHQENPGALSHIFGHHHRTLRKMPGETRVAKSENMEKCSPWGAGGCGVRVGVC